MNMSNTQGLDALAALCGTSASAKSQENALIASSGGGPTPQLANANGNAPTIAAASMYAQQQMQQAHASLQLQQLMAMCKGQQQQQQQQATVATASLPPQAVHQLQNMLAAAQQQQQANAYGQAQALATQMLAAQQEQAAQQQQHQLANSAAAVAHQGLAAVLSPAALASLAAGAQVLPGAVPTLTQLDSSSPAATLSPSPQHPPNEIQIPSPSTIAMPPPPAKIVPSLPLSNPDYDIITETTAMTDRNSVSERDGSNTSNKQSSRASKPNNRRARSESVAASITSSQPPIQDIITEWEGKKHAKRAANRLSAHLSRKRKKMFIEDLKDENVELRRKELILRSIPDLIVVFDSSGCISFVSHSVTRFLDYTSEELADTSIWERLTQDSVRLIKSAFMDAMAVKTSLEEDSTPLANGESMTVTLLPKNAHERDAGLVVSLKGVVHFAGESPECVCSIRPEGGIGTATSSGRVSKKMKPALKGSSLLAAARNRQERGTAVSVGPSSVGGLIPSHRISDTDSQQS